MKIKHIISKPMQQITLHKGFLHSDKEVVISKPDKNKDKTVWHRIDERTLALGYPEDHPNYAKWRANAEKVAKGQSIVKYMNLDD